MSADLQIRQAGGGMVSKQTDEDFNFILPPTSSGKYALGQLDDYMHRSRGQFLHRPPISLNLEARVSAPDLPGTWGFGFWNDPFSAGFGAGGMRRILPVLPNAVWFFYGSKENHLSLHNDLPGSGFHARVFQSTLLPSVFSLLALPALPLLLIPLTARLLRRVTRRIVREDAAAFEINLTEWHQYRLVWQVEGVEFMIDGQSVFSTPVAPWGRLGLVIWIDNQFFKFTPEGKLGLGFLGIEETQSMAVRNLTVAKNTGYD